MDSLDIVFHTTVIYSKKQYVDRNIALEQGISQNQDSSVSVWEEYYNLVLYSQEIGVTVSICFFCHVIRCKAKLAGSVINY